MKRNLIIIGGGILQVPIIQAALDMQLHVIVFDMAADAPGMKLAHEPILMSTRDIEGCAREAKKLAAGKSIHGVVTAGTDASRAVAAIAGALDLPGIRYADAEAASNKVLMRKRLESFSLPIPGFFSVWSLKEAREAMYELAFPLVLKPADNMGARGVVKVRAREEIFAAFRHAKKFSPTGEMILEEFMSGPELSVDALAWNGQYRITGIADRIISGEPYFVERGHTMPSAQSAEVIRSASDVMVRAMQALGIHTGAGKGDLKVTTDGVKIGEIAARLSGGYMSSHTYPLHSGVNLLRGAIQIALGDEPDGLHPDRNLVAIERGILPSPGKILSIGGEDAMRSVPGVTHVFITKKVGDVLPPPTSNLDKAGHVLAVGKTLEEAEAAAEQALDRFQCDVDESYSLDWKEVENRARARFTDNVCWVCKACDGTHCASGVPGMGGVGRMTTFQDNSRALAEYKIVPRYIREPADPDCSVELFGRKFEHPIFVAPMTGAETNLRGAITEFDFACILLQACRDNGTIGWVGDGASPEKYLTIMKALETVDGFGIPIFKPRADSNALVKRFRAAEEVGVPAVGMDIDAVSFKTMELRKQSTTVRNYEALRMLRDSTRLPFVLKGIMSAQDAREAVNVGMDALVVSNHGGRVLDDMPGTARVLPAIVEAVNGKIPVLVDGGIRSGRDAFKMLALGAQAVLVGRPAAIAAVGGEQAGLRFLLSGYREELKRTMSLCGTDGLQKITSDYILRAAPDSEVGRSSREQ